MDFSASNQVTQSLNQLSDSEGILEDSVDFDDEQIDQEQQTQGQDSDFYEIFRPHNYFESLDLIESFLVAVCKSKGTIFYLLRFFPFKKFSYFHRV